MAIVPHKIVELERMSYYRSVGLQRFHCTQLMCIHKVCMYVHGGTLIMTQSKSSTNTQ